MRIVSDIEECLQGKKSKTLPMSVKGQVHALIEVSVKVWAHADVDITHVYCKPFYKRATKL